MLALAPAKVNLTLDVLGRRDDGYHEIRSVMQTVSLFDEVVLEAGQGLIVDTPVGRPEEDLVYRAARAFYAALGREPAVRITLVKKIPVGAGLGGGSSDAAAVLRALNALHGHPLAPERLMDLAAGIGSDVPYFLVGGTALVEGRGERVTRLAPLPERRLALVVPPRALSTAAVYAALDPAPPTHHTDRWLAGGAEAFAVGNALEAAAFRLAPDVARLKERLAAAGLGPVALSGSGSALFAPVSGQGAARAVEVARAWGAQVFLVSTVAELPRLQPAIGRNPLPVGGRP